MAEGIPANFLVGGIKPGDNLCVLKFHQRMHFELIYARRLILVLIQELFGHQVEDGGKQVVHIPAWPVDVKGEDFGQFIKNRENFTVHDWYKTVKKSLNHVNRKIFFEQKELHHGQYAPELNSNQKKAKYLEMAASGLAYLDKKVFETGNLMFNKYIKACQDWLSKSKSEGEDREIKQLALNIWKDKIDKLTRRVKTVLNLQNWLLQVAEVFYDQPENEPNEPLKQQLYRVLSRAYFRLYWTPDEVPTDDLANFVWKWLNFDLRFKKVPPPNDQKLLFNPIIRNKKITEKDYTVIKERLRELKKKRDAKQLKLPNFKKIWYDPEQLKKKPTLIKGRLGELEIRRKERGGGAPAEELGAPPISEESEPGEEKQPDTKHKLNKSMFQLLQDLHRELIWGRRQIILVIQMIFGDLEQGKLEFPDEPDGRKFDIESRENHSLDNWMSLMKLNVNQALDVLRGQQPKGEVRLDDMPLNNQKKAKYLGVALMGFEHIIGLTKKATSCWGDFHTECRTLLTSMQEGSPEERQLDKLHEAVKKLLENFYNVARDGQKSLEPMVIALNIPDVQVNLKELKKQLSKIYYQFYPILDQVPLKMFCDVAYKMFGWNWTIPVKKKKKLDKMTWFDKLSFEVRIRRIKGIGRRKAGGAAKGGGAPEEAAAAEEASEGGEESSEEEGAAGGSP